MKIINFSRRVFQNLTLKTIENSVKNGLAYKNRCKIRNICFLSSSLRHENYKIGDCTKERRLQFAPNGERIITHVSNFRKVKRVEDVLFVFKKINELVMTVVK